MWWPASDQWGPRPPLATTWPRPWLATLVSVLLRVFAGAMLSLSGAAEEKLLFSERLIH